MTITTAVLCALLGYLLGAIPTGAIVGQLWHGVTPHRNGSGHTGGLNVFRTTKSMPAAAITGLVDFGLGILAVAVARTWFASPWAGPLSGIMAVWGHNYSIFIGFRGGVGMSTIFGAMVTLSLPAAVAGALVLGIAWLAVKRVLRHAARSTVVVMLLLGPLMWLLRQPTPVLAVAVFGAIPIVLKELGDLYRVYHTDLA